MRVVAMTSTESDHVTEENCSHQQLQDADESCESSMGTTGQTTDGSDADMMTSVQLETAAKVMEVDAVDDAGGDCNADADVDMKADTDAAAIDGADESMHDSSAEGNLSEALEASEAQSTMTTTKDPQPVPSGPDQACPEVPEPSPMPTASPSPERDSSTTPATPGLDVNTPTLESPTTSAPAPEDNATPATSQQQPETSITADQPAQPNQNGVSSTPPAAGPDETPPPPTDATPSLEPIDAIIARLLGLRGSPPGTLCSLSEAEIKDLCQRVRPIVLAQPMLLKLEAPIKICGDVHGQYTDLLRLFEYGGFPPSSNYLFLGDYVDRGKQSLETICLLFAYKIKYPLNFFLLRGNHESAGINRIYGFYDECKRRYSIKLWKVFSDCFNCLPISALVDEKILCMHGGLSPELNDGLHQIDELMRPADVPDVGLMCDLLWSDPDTTINGWAENDRGVSFVFGADVVAAFLERHDLDLLVRAHQVVEDGYEFFAGRRLVTLFSAPNYCGEFDNAGGMISVDENLMCSFQILKPSSRAARFAARNSGGGGGGAPVTVGGGGVGGNGPQVQQGAPPTAK